MATQVKVAEKIRPMCDHRTAITRLTSDISGKYGLFIETIWNAHEHGGANHIWITVVGRGSSYEVVIVDDGKGMDAQRRARSLCMAKTAEVQTGRNYQDLGLKRLAADFKHVKFLTISAEEKKANPVSFAMCTMEYDFDWLIDVLADNADRSVDVNHVAPDYKAIELPDGATGTKIYLTQVREGRPHFTAERLRKELASYLRPDVADKVYVNGLPLEKRQIIGEPYQLHVDNHPQLGVIEVELYIPKTKSLGDELKVGPFEGVCNWSAFSRDVPPEILGDRLSILSEGVFGEVRIEAFKRFVTANRQGFEVALFSTPTISHFVDFMEHEVCPGLERLMGVIKKAETDAKDQHLLGEITKYLKTLGGGEHIGPRPNPVLILSASFLEMLPNQSPVEVRVEGYDPRFTIEWNISLCGGKADVSQDNRQVMYRPGSKVGAYELTCWYRERPDITAKVAISIVAKKELRIHPQRVTVHPGRTKNFFAVNWEHNSSGKANLRWRKAQDDVEGMFLVDVNGIKAERRNGYGEEAIYRAGYKEGTYRIELFDSTNRKALAVADVTVAQPAESKSKGGGRNENDVVIEGSVYQVEFDYMERAPVMSRLFQSGSKKQIRINRCHPACKHVEKIRGDDGLIELAVSQVLMQHIDEHSRVNGENLTGAEKTRRFADLYGVIVEGFEQRT